MPSLQLKVLPYVFFTLFLTAPSVTATGFTIIPTFDDSINNDTNGAAIKSTIQSVINTYEMDLLDPISVYITFKEMGSGLGESDFNVYPYSYNYFHTQLQADATSADDTTALAQLPGGMLNPVTGTPTVLIKSANAKALGFSPIADGASDGTVSFNASITTPGLNGAAGAYNLTPVIEHEIDEVLGLGSTLGTEMKNPEKNDPSPEDFFRYSSDGTRTFTTSTTALAYFSIDGKTDLNQFNNTGSGDYGDWLTGATVAQVQDAIATPGLNPPLNVELRALDVIGYDLAAPVPEPASVFLFASGLGLTLIARRKLRSGTGYTILPE